MHQTGLAGRAVTVTAVALAAAVFAVAVLDVRIDTLLLLGAFLLCPLLMVGMHGSGHQHDRETGRPDAERGAKPSDGPSHHVHGSSGWRRDVRGNESR